MPGAPLEAFVERIPDPLHCAICQEVAYPPVIACGAEHLLCEDCSAQLRRRPAAQRNCPTCRGLLRKRKHVSSGFKRVIEGFQFRCRYAEEGCSWVGSVGEEQQHATSCEAVKVGCSACGALVPAGSLDAHEAECPEWLIDCPNAGGSCCNWLKRRHVPDHLKVCRFEKCGNYDRCKTVTTKQLMLLHKPACDTLCASAPDPAPSSSNSSDDSTDSSSSSSSDDVPVIMRIVRPTDWSPSDSDSTSDTDSS